MHSTLDSLELLAAENETVRNQLEETQRIVLRQYNGKTDTTPHVDALLDQLESTLEQVEQGAALALESLTFLASKVLNIVLTDVAITKVQQHVAPASIGDSLSILVRKPTSIPDGQAPLRLIEL